MTCYSECTVLVTCSSECTVREDAALSDELLQAENYFNLGRRERGGQSGVTQHPRH